MNGNRGKRLHKIRRELTERTVGHIYETGAMRRVHLQGRENILKRLLVHATAFNLSLMLRKVLGAGLQSSSLAAPAGRKEPKSLVCPLVLAGSR